jgi:crossover junction endodeoxyribonuclease RuvC
MRSFIGIDPGKKGAIAIIDVYSSNERAILTTIKMPDTVHDLVFEIGELSPGEDTTVILEKVHSMPGNSARSMFTFGKWYGYVEAALAQAGFSYKEVAPNTWMKKMGCQTGGDKNVTKAKAQQLWPKMKITHNIADSILIAEYARLTAK